LTDGSILVFMKTRYLAEQVRADLRRKMVFVAGPRQVGKTTMARQIIGKAGLYLNWDVPEHRETILRRELPAAGGLVLDEIHKYRSWRNYLKGLVDEPERKLHILVVGSARLDIYRFGGDSLQGRYHFLRLHPFSAAELKLQQPQELLDLLTLGGFPEPYLSGSQTAARRWSRSYRSRVIREEVASLEHILDLGNLELLALRLPELVGSPLSINALREDLQVSHKTVSRWLMVLERLYFLFRLPPFGAPAIRAVKKEAKHYHYDWSQVPELPQRFENLVASHLLKWVHFQQDAHGRDVELRYFRDVDGREVDFVICENRKPLRFIEVKWDDAPVSPALSYLKKRFPEVEALQISAVGRKDFLSREGIRVRPALPFLRELI
jgi:predicted AAA+ superfamily ATPase